MNWYDYSINNNFPNIIDTFTNIFNKYPKNEYNNNMNNFNIIKSFKILKNNNTGQSLYLKEAIKFNIEISEDGFYYSSDRYNIYVYAETQEDAENNLLSEFLVQYNAYAMEADEHLDDNAKLLKDRLLSIYGNYYE